MWYTWFGSKGWRKNNAIPILRLLYTLKIADGDTNTIYSVLCDSNE